MPDPQSVQLQAMVEKAAQLDVHAHCHMVGGDPMTLEEVARPDAFRDRARQWTEWLGVPGVLDENRKLRKTLAFYADPATYAETADGRSYGGTVPIFDEDDCGDKARAALGEVSDIDNEGKADGGE